MSGIEQEKKAHREWRRRHLARRWAEMNKSQPVLEKGTGQESRGKVSRLEFCKCFAQELNHILFWLELLADWSLSQWHQPLTGTYVFPYYGLLLPVASTWFLFILDRIFPLFFSLLFLHAPTLVGILAEKVSNVFSSLHRFAFMQIRVTWRRRVVRSSPAFDTFIRICFSKALQSGWWRQRQ